MGSSNAFVTTSKKAATKKLVQSSNNLPSPTANGGTYTTSLKRHLYSQPSPTTTATTAAEDEELTPETIAEMIEVSFIQSCLQLSQGYVDVLKLFIVAVKTGYETNLSLEELHDLVQDCPVNSAGRDLMKEELALRREWMMMVYEMMKVLKVNENQAAADDDAPQTDNDSQTRVAQVVESMLNLQTVLKEEDEQSGGQQDVNVALTTLSVESAMEKLPSLTQLLDSIENPVDKAFLTNDVRVALLTFKVLDEERVCLEDAKGSRSVAKGETIPRPPIKGT
eukprot:CAMPEP_0113414580 /NCGR_PEP_ID=MMETSP0013_2-20120614/24095_1 /TAXON_ID=2843 ORGANISM="Skeletonema costatum, Strain 1716" /NCGR_SAMPLE_ID=MMETSP0013_2 /ASSEMBLY_ACC=CAM_ASM_000158 /LENGTH=279 /DNA_ID=CAMNT_0000301451 /DNA_START=208 /DNA_END=1047 /DNA_ORIENTATION=+ /assembly_acc=CAM_ASM_000158